MNNINSKPLISVVTIVFNGDKYLQETIDSVAKQDYKNYEYIIIDGGSIDKTIEIIKSNSDKVDRWISEPDRGISDAFNKGINLARGKVVSFINADDYYENDKVLSSLVENLPDHDLFIAYGRTLRKKLSGEVIGKPDNEMSWYLRAPFSFPSCFISKSVFEKVGLFSLNHKIAMDIEFLFRAKDIVKLIKLDTVVAVQRDGGISDIQRLSGYREFLDVSKNYNVLKAYFFHVIKLTIFAFNRCKKWVNSLKV